MYLFIYLFIYVFKFIYLFCFSQIFEGSEYSSEYNRNTLEFNAGVTSSPIATKLPRVSHQVMITPRGDEISNY